MQDWKLRGSENGRRGTTVCHFIALSWLPRKKKYLLVLKGSKTRDVWWSSRALPGGWKSKSIENWRRCFIALSDDATGLLSKFTEHSSLNCEKFYFKSKTVLVLLSNQRQWKENCEIFCFQIKDCYIVWCNWFAFQVHRAHHTTSCKTGASADPRIVKLFWLQIQCLQLFCDFPLAILHQSEFPRF